MAGLNLVAGKRAKGSTAYASALTYLKAGAALLAEDSWERHRELMFALELNRAEWEILTGQLSVADHRLAALANRATTVIEQASVVCLHTDLCTLLDQSDRAVAVCLNYLRQVGIDWSPHPKEEEVLGEYERVRSLLGDRTIEILVDLPLMQDPASLATIEVLSKLMPPALFTDANLTFLTSCKAVSLSLERGNCDASCFAYVTLGSQTGKRFGDYNTGFRFAKLGYDLVERRGLKRFEAGTSLRFAAVVAWMKHVRACRDPLRRAYDTASRIGDLTIGAYACNRLITVFLLAGEPLPEVQAEAERGLSFVETARFGLIADIVIAQLALTRMLRGLTLKFGCFDDGQFNELRIEYHLSSSSALAVAAFCYWVRKLQARYLAGDYGVAVDAASKAQPLLWTTSFLLEEAEYHFYSALSQAASYELAAAHERQRHLDALAAHHKQLQTWAENCPENFENRAALVGAEIARVEGRDLDAGRLYEQAVLSARANGFVHNEALACETAARFYTARGFEDIAEMYLLKARDGYLRWGADGKVRQLEARHPQLAMAGLRGGSREATSPDQQLDLAAVIKASQALSSEILLPRLIEQLMIIALQNAGADHGLLILPAADQYSIRAEARAAGEQIEVTMRQEPISQIACPEFLVRYVIRTRESVILDDAANQNLFSEDPYLGLRQPRSILCLPLIRQGTLGGLLYLENTLASRVFTPDRARLLELLTSQAAISLENTRLYGDLQDREARVRRLIDSNIVGIVIWGLEGEIVDANDAFLTMVGYDRNDLATGTMRWTELTPPNWRRAADERVEDLRVSGSFQAYEKEYLRKDGSRVPVLVGGATFSGAGDQGFAIVVDLTDRKQAEQAARESERRYHEVQMELAHVNRVATVGQLSASIAHEVNQPLSGIVTNASTLARMLTADPPNIAGALETARRAIRDANRASDIITRLRTLFAKKETSSDLVNLNEASNEIISLSQREFQVSGVVVRSEFTDDLPPVKGDRVQLQQVLFNLIRNGLDAMSTVDDRQKQLIITIAKAEHNNISVAVQDSGPGIDPTNLERIFEAFYTTKPSGLGMGLSICRTIIEAHGGKLWATAAAPQGTILQFTLPAADM